MWGPRPVEQEAGSEVLTCDLQGCRLGQVKAKTKTRLLAKGYADVICVDLKIPDSNGNTKLFIASDAGAEARLPPRSGS